MKKGDITITARIIYGSDEWVRTLYSSEWNKPIWKIFPETAKQAASEQYIKSLKFIRKLNMEFTK